MNKYSVYVNTKELKKSRIKRNKTYKNIAKKLRFKSLISYYNIKAGIVEINIK